MHNTSLHLLTSSVGVVVTLLMIFSPIGPFTPTVAHAAGEQITIGMPFTGNWAYDVLTTAGCGYTSDTTAHPSCHGTNGSDLLGYHWAVDYYKTDGTAVKVHGTSPQGTVTFSTVAASGNCGDSLTVTAKVNSVNVGQMYVTHLNNSVVSSNLANESSIGTVRNECYGVDHVHFSYKNTVANHACYVNHSTSTASAGMEVAYGASVGVLGSANTGVQQVCASVPGTGGSYQAAFNSGNLWLYGPAITANTGLGMMSGTSPAITKLSTGGYQTAFHASDGKLWVYGDAGSGNTGLGMKPGTSPSITSLPNGGYKVAFQANSGKLWVYGTGGTSDTGYGMAAGTSPAIAEVTGGYEVAFNSGTLWLWGNAVTKNTGYSVAAGTSPAITSVGGSYQAAFNSGTLWVVGADGTANSGLGMMSGTSPGITTVSDHYQASFQANSGKLWVYGTAGSGDTGYGMASGTSPAMAPVTGGYEVGFNSGNLWLWGNAGTKNTGYGMASGTSPSLTKQ